MIRKAGGVDYLKKNASAASIFSAEKRMLSIREHNEKLDSRVTSALIKKKQIMAEKKEKNIYWIRRKSIERQERQAEAWENLLEEKRNLFFGTWARTLGLSVVFRSVRIEYHVLDSTPWQSLIAHVRRKHWH
jgi:hypothetical protein